MRGEKSKIILLSIAVILFSFLDSTSLQAWTSHEKYKKKIRRQRLPGRREAENLYNQAEEYFLNSNYQEVINITTKIVSLNPRSRYADDALYLRGVSYLKKARYEQAREDFNRILDEYPRSNLNSSAKTSLADSYYLAEDVNEAIIRYREFAIDNPRSPLLGIVYFRLGRCYQKKGRWGEAEYYFKKVCKDYPLSFEATQAATVLEEDHLYFTVQVGSFREKTNALEIRDRLKKEGQPAYLSQIQQKGELLYRVRVGKFDTRSEAVYTARQLKKKGYLAKIYP